MPFTFLTVVLAAGSIQMEPRTLTFGPASASLEFIAPGASAMEARCVTCEAGATAGTLSTAEPTGAGRFRARFTLPKERFPRVVLLSVEVRLGNGDKKREWVALPLLANASLKLETKPRASVTVTIGPTSVGPMQANARGRLTVPVVVPPGFAAATVVAGDRAGNVSTTSFDLTPQPFPRAVVAGPRREVVAAEGLELEVFAVERTGAWLADATRLHVTSRLGKVEAPVLRGDGVFTVGYRAPTTLASEADEVSVAADDAPATRLLLQLRAGPADRVHVTLSPAEFIAGSGTRVKVEAVVTDQWGNPVRGAAAQVSPEWGTVEPTPGGARLTLPDQFAGRKQLRVRASAPGLSGEATLALRGGPPVEAKLTVPPRVDAGGTVQGTLSLRDAWENPADATGVSVSTSARAATLRDISGPDLAVDLPIGQDDPSGTLTLAVRAGERALGGSSLTVFPYRRPWGFTAGVLVGAGLKTKVGMALVSPRAFVGLRLGKLPIELGLEGSYTWFSTVEVTNPDPTGGRATLAMHAWSAGLSGRFSTDLTLRWSLQLALTLGLLFAQASLTDATHSATSAPRAPLAQVAAGVGCRVPGGRLLLQLEFGMAPLSGSPNVKGNALGGGAALGYLASF